MRIAVGGIHIESSTFNPVPSRAADFRVLRGADMMEAAHFGFLRRAADAEFLPTIHARAMPGGPVEAAAYAGFRAEFAGRLAELGEIDGLYLAMHGAMFVEGMEDAEADWIEAAREIVGPNVPIAASYDLHGNLSARIVNALDMLSAYRTAPHIDVHETMIRAVSMLARSIQERTRPSIVWTPIPVVLPGERTSTVDEPAASLYARLPAIDAIDGIWDASLLVGYVWTDEPRATAAAVMTGTNLDTMEREAFRIAQAYWDARERFVFGMTVGTIDECLDLAEKCASHPVILADSGDNPTGGGVGDRPDVLRALITRDFSGAIVAGIVDAPATRAAFVAGAGCACRISIGATLDPSGGPPVEAMTEVVSLSEDRLGREALVQLGGIRVVLSEHRRPYHTIADFARLGIDPRAGRLIVVKSGYLSPSLAAIANPNLMALSPGVVDQEVTRAPRHRMPRPTFPFDRDFDWKPRAILSKRCP